MLFSSCNRTTVDLEFTNAKDEVPQLGNLTFRFSRALVTDSMLNRWDSSEYISFEPDIRGRFRWENNNELVFSPSRPLAPATSYKASLTREILRHSSYGRISDPDKIAFHTPGLAPENINVSWVLKDENARIAVPQVDLYFNYPVDPAAAKDNITIEADGKRINYHVQTLSAHNRMSLQLMDVVAEDREYDLKIVINKGLSPAGGGNGMAQLFETRRMVPSPYVLNINDVMSEHDGTTGTIAVSTSQQLPFANLASHIRLNPAVKFSVELTEDGFLVSGENFDASKSYELTIEKGLQGKIGGVLKEEFHESFAFGNLAPSIAFKNNKAVYLSAQGAKNIEIQLTNVPKIKIVVSKIYENNILTANQSGYYPKESLSENVENSEEFFEDAGDATAGDVIYEKEIDAASLPRYGRSRLLNFNISDRLPDFRGIYHVMVRSTRDYWVRDSRFISLSDIGLIAKEGKDKVFIFANSIKSTLPVNGVNMLLYGYNSQLLGMASTNADGVAEINYARKEFAGFRPALIIAKSANDFNYLPFNSTKTGTSRFDVSGKRSNNTGLDAFIYAERDIYRPGETVNFSVIVRSRVLKSPGEVPVKFKFLMPNGKELKSFRKNLNEQGSVESNVNISTSAVTGTYSLELYTANDILLSSKPFMVEEFVPDRIRVTATLDKPILQPGDATMLHINAVNFFGPPAANRNYEAEIQVKQKSFSSPKYSHYDFTFANQKTFFDKIVKEGRTDESGNSTILYNVPEIYRNIGMLQSTFFTTVFDETGRPVSRSTKADIFTQPIFLGLGVDGYGYYSLNQAVRFPLIAVDKDGVLVNGTKAQVKIIKHEYRTVLAKSGNLFRYDSQKEDKLVTDQVVAVSGENTGFSFTPRSPGEYEIRLSLPEANSYVSRSFYSYGGWGGDNHSFEVNNEGNIDISADKASYLAGETAKILFKTPFSGRMLVTMETDNVLSYQYVNVEKRSVSIDMKLSAAHLPNVYITAVLIKPHDVSDIPLTVAHGFQSVNVEEKGRKIGVEIVAQKSVRSGTRQHVKVRSAPGSYVTLAAVDNGVLQVSSFKTPDPYGYFNARKALEVTGYDIYPLLFPEVRARLSSTGGDGEIETSRRTNPMPAKRIKILSYWSGITKANGNGDANFAFDIPRFSGQVRLMAVAYKDERFGSAEALMTVADPIVLSSSMPRFLTPGDTLSMPVTITNTTGKSTTAVTRIKVSGPLQVTGSSSRTISLGANSEAKAFFKIVASTAINTAKVMIEVNGLGQKFTEETEISVRPASAFQKNSGSGSITANAVQNISIGTGDFIPATAGYRLVVSRSPVLRVANQLNYLMQYPFGCTEQVISSAFPRLYHADLSEQVPSGKPNTNANAAVQEAIRLIKIRQLYNGSVLLWDNESTENWWVTTYAAHFLLEAKKAGYDVDHSLVETIMAYINNKLKNRQTITYVYNRDNQRKIAPKEVAYTLYVLAMAGRPNISVMNYYKSNRQVLSLDSRYLLSAAFAIAGDKASFRALLPGSFSGEESVPQTGGSFYSDIRDEAIALNVLIEADAGNAQIPVMAEHVIEKLQQRSWYSTQESAFSFLAIGKLAKAAANSTVTGEVKVNGKLIGRVSDRALTLTAAQLGGTQVNISSRGTGRLYYWWQSEGVSASGSYKEEDSYIKVRRTYFDRYGRMLIGSTFKQNDLVVVRISLEKSYSGNVANIAITDILPAGCEIENPRIKELPGMEWIKDAGSPTQLDIRDDRINLFVDLNANRQNYYYALRAVSTGVYRVGPVSANAMYNGGYHSYHGAGTIRVIE